MKILFSHQNYPAQFGAFGSYLAQRGWEVWFATSNLKAEVPKGCHLIKMTPHREPTKGVHRYASPLEQAMINGQAFANACIQEREKGFVPDVVVAHSGWGSGTFAKAVWPDCKYVAYVEWYYRWPPLDQVAASQDHRTEDRRAEALARNAPTLLDLAEADLVQCPTQFQADQFPERTRDLMQVLHDGVHTRTLAPNPDAAFRPNGTALPQDAEIISYATRGMEPHRGFPQFMRALAKLQKSRPKLHAIIGGEDRVAYGPKLPEGESWKEKMLADLDLDETRLHFVGLLPRGAYTELLQTTHLHVYLTVPFVLSWSLIEAMSIGCPIVASDNAATREALDHNRTALLVDHNNQDHLVAALDRLLEDRAAAKALGNTARLVAQERYDTSWIWPCRAHQLETLVNAKTA